MVCTAYESTQRVSHDLGLIGIAQGFDPKTYRPISRSWKLWVLGPRSLSGRLAIPRLNFETPPQATGIYDEGVPL